MKRRKLQPNAKESLAINENCFWAFESSPSFHVFSIVSKSATASFSAKSGDGGQDFFREIKSVGLLNCIRDWKIERWPNGYGRHRSSGSSSGFSLNPCETSVEGRARKSSIPTLLPVKSRKKRLNLSESKPSTSTCGCAPDWKECKRLLSNLWICLVWVLLTWRRMS